MATVNPLRGNFCLLCILAKLVSDLWHKALLLQLHSSFEGFVVLLVLCSILSSTVGSPQIFFLLLHNLINIMFFEAFHL